MTFLLASLLLLGQQPDTLRLPDVVSTATRLPVAAAALGGSRTVILGEELRERGVVLLLDALREVPGLVTVQAGSHGAAASLFMRGGESDYVKVLLDGVPLNAPGGSVNLANIRVENVERIEVVRGPASVVHGADAMTGVIQVFTRGGAAGLAPELTLEAGSRGLRQASAAVRTGGRVGTLSVQAATLATDGLYQFNNDYRATTFSARAVGASGWPVQAEVVARVGDSRAAFPTNSSGEPVDSNQAIDERHVAVRAAVGRQLAPGFGVQLLASATRVDDAFRDTPDHPADSTGFGFAASRDGRMHRTGAEARLTWAAGGPWALTSGLAYEDERQHQAGATASDFGDGPFTEYDRFRASRSTRTLYAEVARQVGTRVTVSGGWRLDDNSAFGTAASWRAGGAVETGHGLTLRAQAGRAFKAPTFPELFADSPFEVGDPSLRPEVARSWEAGLEQRLADGAVRVSAAWFSQRFRNLIQYVAAAPGEPTYGNVAAATSRGVELGMTAIVARDWSLQGQVSVLRTEVTDAGGVDSPGFREGEALLRRPAFTASASLRWQPALRSLVRVDLHHLGRRDDVDFRNWPAERVALPARTVTDLHAVVGLPGLGARLTARAGVTNLFGARWEQVVGFRAAPRTLHLGLALTG